MKETKEKSIHAGHRNRLREKVRKFGLKSLSEHEVIELILNYAIPRKNTNPLAHALINEFGSLSKVIDADYYDLLKVDGVGKEAALYINIISSLMQEYRECKAREENIIIKNTIEAVKYFRQSFPIAGPERMHVVCLSKMNKIVSSFSFVGKDDAGVNFDFKVFMDKINVENAASILMFHTHPNGNVDPSKEDLITTQRCVYISSLMGLNFLDHLILNENQYHSMAAIGEVDLMKRNSYKLVDLKELPNDIFEVKSKNYGIETLKDIDIGDILLEDQLRKENKKKKSLK